MMNTDLFCIFGLNHCSIDNVINILQESDKYRIDDFSLMYTKNCPEGCALFSKETEKKAIALYGDIVNIPYLAKELSLDNTARGTYSDAQIVLTGIYRHGFDFLKRVEGKFAAVVYDINRKSITIFRDKVGSVPLFYYYDESFLIVSSQIKSILNTGVPSKKIDYLAFSQFLQLTYIPSPRTIYNDIKKVPPATVASLSSLKEIQFIKYWDLQPEEQRYTDFNEAKKQLRETLISAVSARCNGVNSIGTFLSGGFDSTIITGIASKLISLPINTFTIGFDNRQYDESSLASIVAKKNHTNHHVLQLTADLVKDRIRDIVASFDEPYADSSVIAAFMVSEFSKEYCSTILTGDAGDELFAGYDKYLIGYYSKLYRRIPSFLRNGVIRPTVKILPVHSSIRRKADKFLNTVDQDVFDQRKSLISLGFKEHELSKLCPDLPTDSLSFLYEQYMRFDVDEQTRAQYVDFCTVLEGDMLPKMAYAEKLSGVKTRSPILDTGVIKLAFGIPSNFKINGKRRKVILKEAFSDLIPQELLRTKKHGFGVPMERWIESILADKLFYYSSSDYLDKQGLFSVEYIQSIIHSHFAHTQNRFSELWAFYVFQEWCSINEIEFE